MWVLWLSLWVGVGDELGIGAVALAIPLGLLLDICLESRLEVDARLVGYAEDDPQHVSEFVAEVMVFVALLEALLAVEARHQASHFADLLGEDSHIRQGREVAHAIVLYPFVDEALRLPEGKFAVHWLGEKGDKFGWG